LIDTGATVAIVPFQDVTPSPTRTASDAERRTKAAPIAAE
jgi:hypothetical protein